MDYGDTLLIFETRGLKSPAFRGQEVGNILHFEEGVVAGGKFYPKGKDDGDRGPEGDRRGEARRQPLRQLHRLRAKPRDRANLHADIEVGHVSAGLCPPRRTSATGSARTTALQPETRQTCRETNSAPIRWREWPST